MYTYFHMYVVYVYTYVYMYVVYVYTYVYMYVYVRDCSTRTQPFSRHDTYAYIHISIIYF